MSDKNLALFCPKCGKRFAVLAGEDQNKDPLTCADCGARVKRLQLKTASGKTLEKYIADMARDAFKGIKGFKPGR